MKITILHKVKGAVIIILLIFSFSAFSQIEVDEKLALQFYQNKEFDKAAELYQRIYSQKPSPFYYDYYLNCLFEIKDYKKARKFVLSVARKNPDKIKYEVEEGYVLQRWGKDDKAKKKYKKLIKTLGKDRKQYIDLSEAFETRGLNNYALKTLEKGKKKISEPPLNMELAALYYQMGEYDAMVSEYLDMAVMNDNYIEAIKSKLQGIITDPTKDKVSDALRRGLLKRTQKNPNETLYAEFLYWYSIQKENFTLALIQSKALDRQFQEQGGRVFELASILVSNKKWTLAVEAYQFIIDIGTDSRFFMSAGINILHAKFKKVTSDKNYNQEELIALEKEYYARLDDYGKNANTAELMVNLAHIQAFYLNKTSSAKELLTYVGSIPNLAPIEKAKAKIQLADMKLFSGEKWSASLLYKQVEKAFKNEPIGYEAKFKAAKFFYYVGEMEWAKTQLAVLRGATSKLIANNAMELYLLIQENISMDSSYDALSIYATADLLHYQHKYKKAQLTLDTILNIFPNHPITDDVFYKKAMIAMDERDFNKADSLFEQTADYDPFGTLADNALMQRAKLNDNILNNNKLASELYKNILLNYPGSLFTVEARKRYREMNE